MPYVITFLCVLALVAYLMADNILWKRRWRRCTRCSMWFSDCGDITSELPPSLPANRIDGYGVCSDCCKDVEFNRQ